MIPIKSQPHQDYGHPNQVYSMLNKPFSNPNQSSASVLWAVGRLNYSVGSDRMEDTPFNVA